MEEKLELLNKQRNNRGPFLIVEIMGGMGKNILATAVVSAIKKKYDDHQIIIVTAWEEPWFGNPDVFRVYKFGQLTYFYDDYIFDDTKIFKIDPYHTEDYILQKKHLIKIWCDLYDIPYNNEQPKLYINQRELELVRDKIRPDGKPIMLLQTNGGADNQYSKKSWARDMPIEIAQKLADYYSKSYRVLHIRREDQPQLNNVEPLMLPNRELYAVFLLSSKRLFIDSFSHHAAKALGLDSVVCWVANKPEVLGYDTHINVRPNANIINELNKYSYLEKTDITGNIQQFPYDTVNLFDINEIVDAVKKIN